MPCCDGRQFTAAVKTIERPGRLNRTAIVTKAQRHQGSGTATRNEPIILIDLANKVLESVRFSDGENAGWDGQRGLFRAMVIQSDGIHRSLASLLALFSTSDKLRRTLFTDTFLSGKKKRIRPGHNRWHDTKKKKYCAPPKANIKKNGEKPGPLLVQRQFIRAVIAFRAAHSFSPACGVSRLVPFFSFRCDLAKAKGHEHTHPVCLTGTGFRGIVLFPHRERKSKRKETHGPWPPRSKIVARNSLPRNQLPLSGAMLTDPSRQSKRTGNHRARTDRAGIAAKSRRKKGGGVVCASVGVLLVAPRAFH